MAQHGIVIHCDATNVRLPRMLKNYLVNSHIPRLWFQPIWSEDSLNEAYYYNGIYRINRPTLHKIKEIIFLKYIL